MNSNARRAPRTRSSFARRAIGLIVAVVMTLGLVVPGSAAAASAHQAAGLSANPLLGPLSAKWWQWVLAQPEETNPLLDSTGAQCRNRQSGPVFFLAGAGNDPVQRTCTVPAGKAIFFPMINIVNFATADNETAQILWDQVHVDSSWTVSSVYASIEGVRLPGTSPANPLYRGCVGPVRGCLPHSFKVTLPEDNLFGLPATTYEPAIADGYYVLIPPLPRGKYTIRFGGTGSRVVPPGVTQNLTQNIEYKITVG